jgi:hypothetical protein
MTENRRFDVDLDQAGSHIFKLRICFDMREERNENERKLTRREALALLGITAATPFVPGFSRVLSPRSR